MVSNTLQKIAAICAITSFVFGIYTTFANNPEWQRYSLFGFALLCLIVWLTERKHRVKKLNGISIFTGSQALPYRHGGVEAEIFYPKPFEYTPNLTISFTEKIARVRGRRSFDDGRPSPPTYEVIEQRTDGFKIKVFDFGDYEYMIKWQAKGQPKN